MGRSDRCLTDAQLQAELERCHYCEEKPCREACPAHCSPADFIMAARVGASSDWRRSAALIRSANPLGWVCGVVCPDYFCMKACSLRTFQRPIEIPAVQAAILQRAERSKIAKMPRPQPNGRTIGIIGAGPAGLGAAAVLARLGYKVVAYERQAQPGGMMRLIPGFRLKPSVIRADIGFVKSLGDVQFKCGQHVKSPEELLARHDAVIVCAGLTEPIPLQIPGQELAVSWQNFLGNSRRIRVKGKRVAVLGGGAVAVDCAVTAVRFGAASVELVYRRRQQDMPLTQYERGLLLEYGVEVASCSRVVAIVHQGKRIKGLRIARLVLPACRTPRPDNFVVSRKESLIFREFDLVVSAIGSRAELPMKPARGVFYAGDLVLGASTVVESVAGGKNAAAQAHAFIQRTPAPRIKSRAKSRVVLADMPQRPVALDAEFFARRILSPFLLSAAPHTDGYEQMRRAYEAGWAGGVMKTSFDNVPIHIPGEYMFRLSASTYGNCDNVSAHPLDRVCREVARLVEEFPERLTLASTGGPVTGDDEADKAVWQSNTRKLENAGAMGIEYSLSCPQGGDGTHGDLVSQNSALTAKIVGWIMETGAEDNPKLFKLTAAVTAVRPIIAAIQEVLERYPQKRAGVTLANSFPSLAFRASTGRRWEEGIIVGMSGAGVLPITNLTLARVSSTGITVSGNGGAMTYSDAANFLALGGKTVQFCSAVMKYGLSYVDELHSGLSYLLADRGFRSVRELIGSALPEPVTDFNELPAVKKLPEVAAALCEHCGNCTRCAYQAVTLNRLRVPEFDPARCVGCSLCAQQCFAGALRMRTRTSREQAAFVEN